MGHAHYWAAASCLLGHMNSWAVHVLVCVLTPPLCHRCCKYCVGSGSTNSIVQMAAVSQVAGGLCILAWGRRYEPRTGGGIAADHSGSLRQGQWCEPHTRGSIIASRGVSLRQGRRCESCTGTALLWAAVQSSCWQQNRCEPGGGSATSLTQAAPLLRASGACLQPVCTCTHTSGHIHVRTCARKVPAPPFPNRVAKTKSLETPQLDIFLQTFAVFKKISIVLMSYMEGKRRTKTSLPSRSYFTLLRLFYYCETIIFSLQTHSCFLIGKV